MFYFSKIKHKMNKIQSSYETQRCAKITQDSKEKLSRKPNLKIIIPATDFANIQLSYSNLSLNRIKTPSIFVK